ncbi:hypothetical protein BVY03_03860 [bacterium K02(2017)]|nr:hypothetical protein BVY03_03860 [bacterium K02(2017)]
MINIKQRSILLLLFGLICLGSYKAIQLIVLKYIPLSQINLLLPFESKIPFIPFFAFIYLTIYILPSWLFLTTNQKGRLFKIFRVFILALLIHLIFFITIPISYPLRPEIIPNTMWYHLLLSIMYQMDAPINTFPSMHVSFSFLSYFFIRRYEPQKAQFVLLAAIAIALSTVFIKQHFIMDVVAGFMVAYLLNVTLIIKNFKTVVSPHQNQL